MHSNRAGIIISLALTQVLYICVRVKSEWSPCKNVLQTPGLATIGIPPIVLDCQNTFARVEDASAQFVSLVHSGDQKGRGHLN